MTKLRSLSRTSNRKKRSVPKSRGRKGYNKAFAGTSTKLDKNQRRMLSKDVNCEVCQVCGKIIYFTAYMSRSDYTYKVVMNNKAIYACGYTHYRQLGGGK